MRDAANALECVNRHFGLEPDFEWSPALLREDAENLVAGQSDVQIVHLDTARAEYAKWFVIRHNVRKRHMPTRDQMDGVRAWRRAEECGYIRFFRIAVHGVESVHEEFEVPYTSFTDPAPEQRWFRLAVTDLDDPANESHAIARRYRQYRDWAAKAKVSAWLLAEAEEQLVFYVAWLRAYGVEADL